MLESTIVNLIKFSKFYKLLVIISVYLAFGKGVNCSIIYAATSLNYEDKTYFTEFANRLQEKFKWPWSDSDTYFQKIPYKLRYADEHQVVLL